MSIAELAGAHAYLAQALCPPGQQQRARETLAFVVGELLPVAARIPWRPRRPELDHRVRRLHQRYGQGISAAHVAIQVALARWGVDTTLHKAAAQTGRLTKRQWRSRDPRGCDVIRSLWAPRRDQAHLLIPLAHGAAPLESGDLRPPSASGGAGRPG